MPMLGEIEIDPRIRLGGDTGNPVAAQGESAPAAQSLYQHCESGDGAAGSGQRDCRRTKRSD